MIIHCKYIILIILSFVSLSGYTQVGINTDDPDPSTALHIVSTNSGVLVPRIENTDSVDNPANGLIVYNTEYNNISVFSGTDGWQNIRPFPKGGIVMWSGSINDIPDDWALCNGHYYNPLNSHEDTAVYMPGWDKTPDLRGKFIVSYDESNTQYDSTGRIGGENITYLEERQLPSHTHVILAADGAHTHTVKQSGSHTHTTEQELGSDGNTGHFHYVARNKSGSSGLSASNCIAYHTNEGDWEEYKLKSTTSDSPDIGLTSRGAHTHEVTNTGSTHTHEINNSGAHKHTIQPVGNKEAIENRPAFYVLAFIMKL